MKSQFLSFVLTVYVRKFLQKPTITYANCYSRLPVRASCKRLNGVKYLLAPNDAPKDHMFAVQIRARGKCKEKLGRIAVFARVCH